MRQDIEEIGEREGPRALVRDNGVGILARQDGDRPREADEADRDPRRSVGRGRLNGGDFRCGIGGTGGDGERHGFCGIRPLALKGEKAHRGVEGEPARFGLQSGRGALPQPSPWRVAHKSTWLPARAGHLATVSGWPRKRTSVRTNEFTVACSARKRSSTEART